MDTRTPPFRTTAQLALPAAALFCLWPAVGSAVALALGIAIALLLGNPYAAQTRRITAYLMAISIIGLGAGMNLHTVIKAGLDGLTITVVSITACMVAAVLIGRTLKADRESTLLIGAGTAICGGSAIAALSTALHAKPHNISAALGVVFALNALALVLFPWAGHALGLTPEQFGLWAALAIHDTSSVVGASMKFGPESVQIATTVKLVRALWIVPLVLAVQYFVKPAEDAPAKRKYPWFILGFVAMAALVTYTPALAETGQTVAAIARRLFVVALLLIGASLTRETLRAIGLRPFLLGVFLWGLSSVATLIFVMVR